jgi:hypothetical protein
MASHSIFIPDPTGGKPEGGATPPAANYDSKLDTDSSPENKDADKLALEAFLTEAKDRFKLAVEAENEHRYEALDDQKFRSGEQWPFEIKSRRDQDGRPCLTINRIPQFLRSITNEQRQNRPAIQINPVGDNSDVKTAEVIEGLVRHIEAQDADIAYDTAFDAAASYGGPGWIRVRTQFVDNTSFDQEILIDSIKNGMMVYSDPNSKDPAGKDLNWVFIVEDLSEVEYKAQYPKSKLAGLPDFQSVGDRSAGWVTKKSVRIAEYYYKEPTERTLLQFEDGSVSYEDQLPPVSPPSDQPLELPGETAAPAVPLGVPGGAPIPAAAPAPAVAPAPAPAPQSHGSIIARRSVQDVKVKWCKINAIEKLEERNDYKGKYIPMIPVIGEEVIVDGKRKLVGVIRFAKDAQRAYNYWTSAETEMIALAPKAPYILEAGQIEGYEDVWKNLNNKNYAYVPYKSKTIGDQLAPPPQRAQWEPPIQAISLARGQAADDLKATTGLYDASLGAQGNETSGRAILARQHEGSTANFHLSDNLARSIRQVGRVIVDLIPYVYDAPRVSRIIGREQQQRIVNIQSSANPNVQPPPEDQPDDDIHHIYDVGMGKYDVSVTTGPSFNTLRQEAVASMLQLTQSYPQIAQFAGDLMVKNMDWPGAQQIAKRLKAMLPPQLQDEEEGQTGQEQKIPPQVQQALQQLTQQNETLTQNVHALLDERDKKILEIASKERIAALQTQAVLMTTEAKLQSQFALTNLQTTIEAINKRLEILSQVEAEQGMAPGAGGPANMPAAMNPTAPAPGPGGPGGPVPGMGGGQ